MSFLFYNNKFVFLKKYTNLFFYLKENRKLCSSEQMNASGSVTVKYDDEAANIHVQEVFRDLNFTTVTVGQLWKMIQGRITQTQSLIELKLQNITFKRSLGISAAGRTLAEAFIRNNTVLKVILPGPSSHILL